MTHARTTALNRPVPPRTVTQSGRGLRLVIASDHVRPRDERLPGEGEPWLAVAPVRPDTAHVRSLLFLDAAGELLAAFAIIGGGMVLTGLASLI